MSFSKAKVQRFNEFENDVPPPGAYDPKFDDKIKGLAINKSERFYDNKTVTGIEHNLLLCNKSLNKTVTSFKTPQPAQKSLVSKSCSKIRPRSILPTTDAKLNHTSEQELTNLKVQCSNKDKIIQDMQETLQKLESQLEKLHKNDTDTKIQHKKDIEAMVKLQQEVLDKHIDRHKSELEHLHKQLLETCADKAHEIQARKDIENDLRSCISDYIEKINNLNLQIEILEKQNKENLFALNEANAKVEELTNTIETIEEKGSDIKENTELFEQEKARREAIEEEMRKLLEYNARLKKDYEEISEKYAELIGHQNHKQRIKHVAQLKDKINQLEEDLRLKIKKIEQQRKMIEKMSAEEKRVPNKFKENFLKMMKDETSTPESSPMKPPFTPLRIIND